VHVPQEAKGGNTEAAAAEAAVGVGVGGAAVGVTVPAAPVAVGVPGAAVGVGVGGAPQPDLQALSLLALLVQKYRY
jgi:hypothetical protein